MNLCSYANDPATKAEIIADMKAHIDAGKMKKGIDWEDGKGSAVGCLTHCGSYRKGAEKLGCSVDIVGLFDTIFEQLPDCESQAWSVQFLEALACGADTSLVWPRFAAWLLADPVDGVLRLASGKPDCESAIRGVAGLYEWLIEGYSPTTEEVDAAGSAALVVGHAVVWGRVKFADSAAQVAGGSAWAAWTAKWAPWTAGGARAAWLAADAAGCAGYAEQAEQAAWHAALLAATRKQRDMLLALLRECGGNEVTQ